MKNILLAIVLFSVGGIHKDILNIVLQETNKGKIWRKDLSKIDKREAAISLSYVISASVVLGLVWLITTQL